MGKASTAAEQAVKRRKALELHLAGATYQAIADTVGYSSKATAHSAVQKALEEAHAAVDLSGASSSELARLDAMLTGLWAKARKGDVAAIDRVLRIEERRAQILTREGREVPESTVKEATSLSDFERRLREREQRASSAPRGSQAG